MALYTFESTNSPGRVAGDALLVDTSYLIAFTDPQDIHHKAVDGFHIDALLAGADFFINVVVRHEFIQKLRYNYLIKTFRSMLRSDPSLEARYRGVPGLPPGHWNNAQTTSRLILDCAEAIYKDYVRRGDASTLLANLNIDLWTETQRLEHTASVTYFGARGSSSWDDLGQVIRQTGLSATDAMIANFAEDIQAAGILTTDCDYAQFSDVVDVYMPRSVASTCTAHYDPALD